MTARSGGHKTTTENLRVKIWTPTARTACRTCKRRRTKCDETKPSCHRCLKIGVVCEGYEVTTATWILEHPASQDSSVSTSSHTLRKAGSSTKVAVQKLPCRQCKRARYDCICQQRPARRPLSTIQLREWTPKFGMQPSGRYKTEQEQMLVKYFLQAGAPVLARSNISVAFWQEQFPRIAYQNDGVKAALMLCSLNLRSAYNHIRLQIPVTGLNPQAMAYENQVIKGLVESTPSVESVLIASCALWIASLTIGEWAKALQHCFHALRIIEGLQDRSKCDPLVLRFAETLSRSALGYFRLTRGPCRTHPDAGLTGCTATCFIPEHTSVELRLADTLYHLSKALASLDYFKRRLESRQEQHKDHNSILELVHRQQREINYLCRRWSDVDHTGVDPEEFKAAARAVPVTLSPFTHIYAFMADLIEHDEQSRFTYKEIELQMRMMLTNFMAASCQNHPVLLADMYLSMYATTFVEGRRKLGSGKDVAERAVTEFMDRKASPGTSPG